MALVGQWNFAEGHLQTGAPSAPGGNGNANGSGSGGPSASGSGTGGGGGGGAVHPTTLLPSVSTSTSASGPTSSGAASSAGASAPANTATAFRSVVGATGSGNPNNSASNVTLHLANGSTLVGEAALNYTQTKGLTPAELDANPGIVDALGQLNASTPMHHPGAVIGVFGNGSGPEASASAATTPEGASNAEAAKAASPAPIAKSPPALPPPEIEEVSSVPNDAKALQSSEGANAVYYSPGGTPTYYYIPKKPVSAPALAQTPSNVATEATSKDIQAMIKTGILNSAYINSMAAGATITIDGKQFNQPLLQQIYDSIASDYAMNNPGAPSAGPNLAKQVDSYITSVAETQPASYPGTGYYYVQKAGSPAPTIEYISNPSYYDMLESNGASLAPAGSVPPEYATFFNSGKPAEIVFSQGGNNALPTGTASQPLTAGEAVQLANLSAGLGTAEYLGNAGSSLTPTQISYLLGNLVNSGLSEQQAMTFVKSLTPDQLQQLSEGKSYYLFTRGQQGPSYSSVPTTQSYSDWESAAASSPWSTVPRATLLGALGITPYAVSSTERSVASGAKSAVSFLKNLVLPTPSGPEPSERALAFSRLTGETPANLLPHGNSQVLLEQILRRYQSPSSTPSYVSATQLQTSLRGKPRILQSAEAYKNPYSSYVTSALNKLLQTPSVNVDGAELDNPFYMTAQLVHNPRASLNALFSYVPYTKQNAQMAANLEKLAETNPVAAFALGLMWQAPLLATGVGASVAAPDIFSLSTPLIGAGTSAVYNIASNLISGKSLSASLASAPFNAGFYTAAAPIAEMALRTILPALAARIASSPTITNLLMNSPDLLNSLVQNLPKVATYSIGGMPVLPMAGTALGSLALTGKLPSTAALANAAALYGLGLTAPEYMQAMGNLAGGTAERTIAEIAPDLYQRLTGLRYSFLGGPLGEEAPYWAEGLMELPAQQVRGHFRLSPEMVDYLENEMHLLPEEIESLRASGEFNNLEEVPTYYRKFAKGVSQEARSVPYRLSMTNRNPEAPNLLLEDLLQEQAASEELPNGYSSHIMPANPTSKELLKGDIFEVNPDKATGSKLPPGVIPRVDAEGNVYFEITSAPSGSGTGRSRGYYETNPVVVTGIRAGATGEMPETNVNYGYGAYGLGGATSESALGKEGALNPNLAYSTMTPTSLHMPYIEEPGILPASAYSTKPISEWTSADFDKYEAMAAQRNLEAETRENLRGYGENQRQMAPNTPLEKVPGSGYKLVFRNTKGGVFEGIPLLEDYFAPYRAIVGDIRLPGGLLPSQTNIIATADYVRPRGTAIVDVPDKGIMMVKETGRPFFGLPGGGAEGGEAGVTAAPRELAEETGVKVKTAEPLFDYTGAPKEFHQEGQEGNTFQDLHYVTKVDVSGTPKPISHEITDIAYYKPGSNIPLDPDSQAIVDAYYATDKGTNLAAAPNVAAPGSPIRQASFAPAAVSASAPSAPKEAATAVAPVAESASSPTFTSSAYDVLTPSEISVLSNVLGSSATPTALKQQINQALQANVLSQAFQNLMERGASGGSPYTLSSADFQALLNKAFPQSATGTGGIKSMSLLGSPLSMPPSVPGRSLMYLEAPTSLLTSGMPISRVPYALTGSFNPSMVPYGILESLLNSGAISPYIFSQFSRAYEGAPYSASTYPYIPEELINEYPQYYGGSSRLRPGAALLGRENGAPLRVLGKASGPEVPTPIKRYLPSLIAYLFPKQSYLEGFESLMSRAGGIGEGIAIRPELPAAKAVARVRP